MTSTTTGHDRLRNKLRELLRHHHRDRPISISDFMGHARVALPDMAISDDELEKIIAEEIIAKRQNIAFDRRIGEKLSLPGN